MENQPGPSYLHEKLEEDTRSLHEKNCKGELTNALKYCESLLRENDLLIDTAPEKISSVSMIMGQEIYDNIINMLAERKVVTEEELILFEESESEGYEEFKDDEDDYEPEEYQTPSFDYIPLSYKARTVALAEIHPKWSLTTLQKKGCTRLTKKEYLKKWKEDVKKGGTSYDKWMHIDAETFEQFKEARASYEQVTSRTLQQWAMAAAFPFISETFTFNASKEWLKKFKRRHRIKQRKITKYVSDKDYSTMDEVLRAAEKFQMQTKALIAPVNKDFVINTDQTGCQYNMTYNRTLEHQGEKTVLVKKKHLNKLTHSYTAQYSLTASGKLLPLVFLCMQESSGMFGPQVQKKIDLVTKEYKNVVVTCSKSGKFTTEMYKHFLKTVILPYVATNKFVLIIDSWPGQTNPVLFDEIFEDDKGEVSCTLKIIPPKCTPLCQPCDVYFYRQVKILIKRMQNAPTLLQEQREISSREDEIKIHSLILHQLSAPAFHAMIQYAWFASKLTSDRTIFLNVNDICFPVSLLKHKCSCSNVGFIQCAWCKTILCFTCFFDKYHPKLCKYTEQE